MFSSATAACAASSIRPRWSSAVNAPSRLLSTSNAPSRVAVGRDQRHAENRFGAIAGLAIDGAVDFVGIVTAAHAARLAGLNHLADDAGVVRQPQLAAFDAERRPADDRLVRLVPQEDAGAVGVEQSRGGLGHAHEQRFHFVGLLPVVRDVEDRFSRSSCGGRALVRSTIARASASPLRGAGEARFGAVAARRAARTRLRLGRRDRGVRRRAARRASDRRRRRRRVPAPRRPGRAARLRRRLRGLLESVQSGAAASTIAAASALVAVSTRSRAGSSRSSTSATSLDRWSRFATMSGIGGAECVENVGEIDIAAMSIATALECCGIATCANISAHDVKFYNIGTCDELPRHLCERLWCG